jgi:hypothetical protein
MERYISRVTGVANLVRIETKKATEALYQEQRYRVRKK